MNLMVLDARRSEFLGMFPVFVVQNYVGLFAVESVSFPPAVFITVANFDTRWNVID